MKAKNWVPASDRQSVSFRLREAIEADGRTAYSLGQEAEVDAGMIQRFVNGERGLSLATVDRLAAALGLRLVEGSRGRGRPSKASRPAPYPAIEPPDVGRLAEPTGPSKSNIDPEIAEPPPCQMAEPQNLSKPDIPPTAANPFLAALLGGGNHRPAH